MHDSLALQWSVPSPGPRPPVSPTWRLGYDVLGPVIYRFLLGLDQFTAYFSGDRTRVLCCARAGGRIRSLYERYLAAAGKPVLSGWDDLWVSRISVCKGVFSRARAETLALLLSQYGHQDLGTLVDGLTRHCVAAERLAMSVPPGDRQRQARDFDDWLGEGSTAALRVQAYLDRCGEDFAAYLDTLLGDADRVVLIDSGWQANIQLLLSRAFPSRAWKGLYAGRMPGSSPYRRGSADAIGILFDGDGYDPLLPASALTQCRHLIETLFEANAPSIEEVPGGFNAALADAWIRAARSERPCPDRDPLYLAVCAYLDDRRDASPATILAAYEPAIAELRRIVITPTRAEALALVCKDRSADFGKDLVVPVLVPVDGDTTGPASRIDRALWRQGQIALEYEPSVARSMQTASGGDRARSAYFDPRGRSDMLARGRIPAAVQTDARIDVVTRTRDRPLLLRRAARSIAGQRFGDINWIVINDGGDPAEVDAVLDSCAVDPSRITLIDNDASAGMEAASNAAIALGTAPLVAIHDDDDSWDPRFLDETVRFLESQVGGRYGGVVTGCVEISETIVGDRIVERARRPFSADLSGIAMADLARSNLFPPISFVYRRSCWSRIGGYNEALPVLGDWFFNLEFILGDEIAVIPEPRAYYHVRGSQVGGASYGNSVVSADTLHVEMATIFRNAFVRKHALHPMAQLVMRFGEAAEGARVRELPIVDSTTGSDANDQADRRWISITIQRHAAQLLRADPCSAAALKLFDLPDDFVSLRQAVKKHGIVLVPPPDFDDGEYMSDNPDVARAVAAGGFGSGFHHYAFFGRREGRLRPTTIVA